MGYLLPWGQMSYWGAQVIVNLFAAVPFIGPDLALLIRGDYVVGDATLNRFFSFHVIAVPLVLLGLVVGAHHRAARGRLEQPRRRRDQGARRTPSGQPLDGIPFHPYYTVHDIFGVARVPVHLQRGRVLRARGRRLLPRVQQLHRGQSAEDAGAHRAGVVLHAVLLDAARDHRPDGQRAVRPSSPSAAVLAILRGGFGAAAKIAIAGRRPWSRSRCSRPSTPSSGASS